MTWSSVFFVPLQHRNKGTFVCLLPFVGHRIDGEKKQYFAELDIIHPELKFAVRDY